MDASRDDTTNPRSSLKGSDGDQRWATNLEEPPGTPSLSPRRTQPYTPYRQEHKEKYIAVGIDFGTTYSGVSWVYSATPDDIHHVAHWPYDGRRSKDEVQIPTQVDLKTNKWGYLVPKDADPVCWFKLLLLKPNDMKSDMKDARMPLQVSQMKLRKHAGYDPGAVVDLIAHFLRQLWEHTLAEIAHEIDVDCLRIKVAITVPAIWPLYARQKMEEAAKKAGILKPRRIGATKLILVEEPEAAAISTLFDRKDHPEIELGECFIVCDCGGGTIDITSYIVTSLDPFIVKEAVKGDGKVCGAFLIDTAFVNWMSIKSGLKFDKCDQTAVREFVNEEWEHGIKRTFTGEETSFSIRPPAKAFGLVKRTKGTTDDFHISRDVVRQFYAKTYNGIRDLISDQKAAIEKSLGKPPKKILLVGGLGSSRYLYSMLQEQYKNVLQPLQAWSAVSRGAVIAVLKNAYNSVGASLNTGMDASNPLRLMPRVDSRIARASYGTVFGVGVASASPPVNTAKETPYEDLEGYKRVHRMEWYLKKGQPVQDRDPVIYDFSSYFIGPDDKIVALSLCMSEADIPSIWPDDSIRNLCKIECEIDTPWEDMEEVRGPDGKVLPSRKVRDLTLSMSFKGAPKWTLKAGGKMVEEPVKVQYA